jgi:dihydrofolate reductase
VPAFAEDSDVRKIILLEHVSLDGYLAGPKGAMDWIHVDDELWEHVHPVTDSADAVIWGRVTYQMMEGYWPTAADSPDASKHDIHHGRWVNAATKIVFSNSLAKTKWDNTRVVKGVGKTVTALKQEPGKNILLIGSASVARAFIAQGLIDEYRLTINPVILGGGTPLFPNEKVRANLKLVSSKSLASGVLAVHYEKA